MPEGASNSGPVIEEDLACAHCGYNLRGLSGNPVRCPECGEYTRLVYSPAPAEYIEHEVRVLAGQVTTSYLALPFLGLAVFFGVGLLLFGGMRRDGAAQFAATCGSLSLLISVLCPLNIGHFYRNSRAAPGWFSTLLACYGYLALTTAGILACVIVAAYATTIAELVGTVGFFSLLVVGMALAVALYLVTRDRRLRRLKPLLWEAATARAAARWTEELKRLGRARLLRSAVACGSEPPEPNPPKGPRYG